MDEMGHWATVCVYERGRLLMLHKGPDPELELELESYLA